MKIDLSFLIILFYRDEGLYWEFVGDAPNEPANEPMKVREKANHVWSANRGE
jgi:hypothetical protein